jgi:hypothetical protein
MSYLKDGEDGVFEDKVEELRATLVHDYKDEEILEALIRNNIVDRKTGTLCEWWLNLLDPNLIKAQKLDNITQEEDIVLNALAKLLKRRIK